MGMHTTHVPACKVDNYLHTRAIVVFERTLMRITQQVEPMSPTSPVSDGVVNCHVSVNQALHPILALRVVTPAIGLSWISAGRNCNQGLWGNPATEATHTTSFVQSLLHPDKHGTYFHVQFWTSGMSWMRMPPPKLDCYSRTSYSVI